MHRWVSIWKSGGWSCCRPVQAEMACRVAGAGCVEVLRPAIGKDVVPHSYCRCKRQQPADDVVPRLGEAAISDRVHLVVEVAILCSRILETVVEGIQGRASAGRRLWRRGWEGEPRDPTYRKGSTNERTKCIGRESLIVHVDHTRVPRSRCQPGVRVLICQQLMGRLESRL